MKYFSIIPSIYHIELIFVLQLHSICCYPIDKAIADTIPEFKDEIHYPNGTVVGKYSYRDNEGNPISVKYYADHSSYGVELNSFKVIQSTKEPQSLPKPNLDYMKPMEPLLDLASEIMGINNKNNDKVNTKNNKLNTNLYKNNPLPHPSKLNSPEFETYYQNEVKAPKQCESDKVRVYLVKEKRKTRGALGGNDIAKYCGGF